VKLARNIARTAAAVGIALAVLGWAFLPKRLRPRDWLN
jgi:hypothetical protein